MTTLTTKALAAQLFITAVVTERLDSMRANDRGQASTEYAGILFVIVAIIAALIALGFDEVGEAIKTKMVEAVNKLKG